MRYPYALLFVVLLISCRGVGPAEHIFIVVRENPGELINGIAEVELDDDGKVKKYKTNKFGLVKIYRDSIKRANGFDSLTITTRYKGKTASIYTNKFNTYYDVNLEPNRPLPDDKKFADMHYHLSLKAHNSFANRFFPRRPPSNINWLRVDTKKITLYNNDVGEWEPYDLHKNYSDGKLTKRYLRRAWIRPNDGANNLKHASEATFPHMLEGNVYLAFNAITPFEHSVSNQSVKRWVSSAIKTGADIKWLGKLGKNGHITHWQNFKAEYDMITSQDTSFNNFNWHTLKRKETMGLRDLLGTKPVVVNVVEGAHIFQHYYFPHAINFDLMDTTSRKKQKLYDRILFMAKCLRAPGNFHDSIYTVFKANEGKRIAKKDSLMNTLFMHELITNVDEFKKMNVHMISISHLSYNGMTGHAPALDVSKIPPGERFTSYLAKRAFGIRVSKDRQYIKSYDGLFFRVPGVNIFGDSVITRLLDISDPATDRFVHIDLKHSDVITRKFILDKYEEQSKKVPQKLRPICSHCAVNGLSIDYYSPLLNEYNLLNSSLARKFYPFAINLFNEEVKRICESEGIIGIPLEERVLGGYINNREAWSQGIRKNGELTNKGKRMNRINYMKRIFRYLRRNPSEEYKQVKQYYIGLLKKDTLYNNGNNKDAKSRAAENLSKLIFREYCSAEPFLQNVFHVVDIARTTNQQTILDSLLTIARRQTITERASRDESSVRRRRDELSDELAKAQSPKSKDSLQRQMNTTTLTNMKDTTIQAAAYFYQDVRGNLKEIISKVGVGDSLDTAIRRNAWVNLCIGSDFDGMIDPIDICGTASQYPLFKEKLHELIPLFLFIRQRFEIKDKLLRNRYENAEYYFNDNFKIRNALDMLFYDNLKEFTANNFML